MSRTGHRALAVRDRATPREMAAGLHHACEEDRI